jgi:hypothetical protein
LPDPLRHVRALSGELGARGATSPGEASAARYIAEAARGYTHQVWQESFRSFPSQAPAWLIALGFSLLGALTLWVHPPTGAVLATVGAVAFAGQAAGWIQLGRLLPHRDSQNVIAVVPARESIQQRLVIVAHYDTGRRWPWPVSRLQETVAAVAVSGAVLGLAAVAVANANSRWLGWAAASVPLLLVVAGAMLALGARERSGPPNDGAVSSAGAVAVGLAAGEGIARAPLRHTEVWVVFTGCRKAGMTGLHALLDRHGPMLADAAFLVLDRFGSGPLVYTDAEGVLPAFTTPDHLCGLLAEVARDHPEWELQRVHLRDRRTQAFALLDRRLDAVGLLTSDLPEGHADQVRPIQLHNAARLVRALAERLDRQACIDAEAERG